MNIKSKAQNLKKRAKDLGYDIKLTHAQEIVASIYGHKTRHSALLEDQKPKDKNLNFYLNKQPIPKDEEQLAETFLIIGNKLGKEFINPLVEKITQLLNESLPLIEGRKKQEILSKALDYGVVRVLTKSLRINPMEEYFKEFMTREFSSFSGLNVIQKVLQKKQKESMESLFKKT